MAEAGGRIGGIYFTISEDNVKLVMKQPWVTIASDAGALNLNAPDMLHPRAYGSNVKVLGHYVRDEKTLTLEDAVRKMSSLPAQILGLSDRGQIHKASMPMSWCSIPRPWPMTLTEEKPENPIRRRALLVVNGAAQVIDKASTPAHALAGPDGSKRRISPAQDEGPGALLR